MEQRDATTIIQEPLDSNTLLLVNVADGMDSDNEYYLHIRYSDHPEGEGELSETPATYIGFYVGPEENAPEDGSKYIWSKYGGESNYIDVRYSDDNGRTLTNITIGNQQIYNGKNPGKYIGVLITDDPIVLQESWYPESDEDITSNIKLSDYSWSKIQADNSKSTSVYYIESDYKVFQKFFTSQSNYEYLPSIVNFYFKVRQEDTIGEVSRGDMTIEYIYYEDNNNTPITDTQTFTNTSNVQFDLSQTQFSNKNLQAIIVKGIKNNNELAVEVFQFQYGTTEDMAKFSINVTDIVAQVNGNKIIINDRGLSINSGNFSIFNDNEQVLYADNSGNLNIKGNIYSSGGQIGAWKIDQYGLYSSNNVVGLYAGGDLIHPSDKRIQKSPIRFWSGKYLTENGNNYSFAVNEAGDLFASNVDITGKIIATEGKIINNFIIGSENEGIVIFGGNQNINSYIGTGLFSSGALGYGWKISQDGTAEFNNIVARGRIQSSVFEYNKISSVGGSLYIAPTIYMENSSGIITNSNSLETIDDTTNTTSVFELYETTWDIPYTSLDGINEYKWQINDEVKIEGIVLVNDTRIELSNIDGRIVNAESIQGNTGEIVGLKIRISFKARKNYSNIVNQKFEPGAIIILYGSNNKRHGLYLTATDSNSPFMDVYDTTEDNAVIPAVRIGNLKGINDFDLSSGTLESYGLYSSNAYLRGQLVLPNAGITNQKNTGYDGNTDKYFSVEENNPNTIRIWAGGAIPEPDKISAPFIVTQDGSLYAKKGIFEGIIKATNGEFSGIIRAAGILLEEENGTTRKVDHDHFFVAYTILEKVQRLKSIIPTDNQTDFNKFLTENSKEDIKDDLIDNYKFEEQEANRIITELYKEGQTNTAFYKFLTEYENNNFIASPYNYVLNIDSTGLSVWQGGLKAYSDYASGLEDTTFINPVYGYNSGEINDTAFLSPLPYFSLVDDGKEEELHARIVAHKGHFMTVEKKDNKYWTRSIIFDNGIWFDENNYNNISGLERSAYYQSSHSNGIFLTNKILNINNNYGISLNSLKTIYINPTINDLNNPTRIEKLMIRGQVNIVRENDEIDNLISLDKHIIREAFTTITNEQGEKENISIGIDIIVS